MYLDAIFYFMVILAIMAVADIISTATRAMIPSMFSISVICIVLFWSGLLPPDVLELAGISSTLVYVIYYLQLPHMGALMSMREMAVQWKTIGRSGGNVYSQRNSRHIIIRKTGCAGRNTSAERRYRSLYDCK